MTAQQIGSKYSLQSNSMMELNVATANVRSMTKNDSNVHWSGSDPFYYVPIYISAKWKLCEIRKKQNIKKGRERVCVRERETKCAVL